MVLVPRFYFESINHLKYGRNRSILGVTSVGYTRISPLPHLHLVFRGRDRYPESKGDRYGNMVEAAPGSMSSLGSIVLFRA